MRRRRVGSLPRRAAQAQSGAEVVSEAISAMQGSDVASGISSDRHWKDF